jgi:signal transduction histidine kinase
MTTATDLHVLLLEDRPDDAELLVMELEDAGWRVHAERVDSRADFEAALRPELDVVLADYSLPSFTLPDALAILRESGLTVPLIVVSGTITDEMAVEALHGGAADFLLKDKLVRLPQAVRSAVEGRELRDLRAADSAALQQTMADLSAANERLRAADAFKDQILAMTSHELRTPLTSILGYVSLLLETWDAEDREPGRRWAETIDRQTRRLVRLVEDLLTLSRLEADRIELTTVPVQVDALLHGTLESLPSRAAVTIHGDLGATVLADGLRVQQILASLVDNAFRHGEPPVLVEVVEDADTVTFRVTDNGSGVPTGFVPQLFDKFTQADAERATGGLGLGLAIARQLAEAQSGSLEHELGAGGGACFTLTLRRHHGPFAGPALPLMRRADGRAEGPVRK